MMPFVITLSLIPKFHSRYREAQIYLRLGRQILKNIQHLRQVLSEILSVTPVPGLAVIRPQLNGNDVRLKRQQVAELLLVHVRMIPLIQHHAGADSEIAHIVPLAQKLGKQSRITVLKLIFNSRAVSDTIAHTGNLYRLLFLRHRPQGE
jgi:hypothetical protein